MNSEQIGKLCDRLSNEYKKDFVQFMQDMNKDLENEMRGEPQQFVNEILIIVNTSLLAMWLGVELAHLTPETAEWMLGNLIKEINQATPHLREVLKQIEELNG